MQIDMTGQRVLITGAAGGIGQAAARAFRDAGARLLLSDLDPGPLPEDLCAGDDVRVVRCDVTRRAEVQAMVDAGVAAFGGIDVAINNAGIAGPHGKLADLAEDAWHRLLAVNLTGLFHCLQAEIPALAAPGGRIVNVASLAGLAGSPGLAAYGATKHGVIGLTRSLAHELGRKGIRVNALCPSFTDTPMLDAIGDRSRLHTPLNALGRFGTPQEMADALLWIASPQNGFMNGQAITLDGGISAL